MEIVKLLKDYSKTELEKNLSEYLSQKLDSSICVEQIRNKKFLLEYVKPINDFLIYTTAYSFPQIKKVL